jgi:protein-disulfide isomerase
MNFPISMHKLRPNHASSARQTLLWGALIFASVTSAKPARAQSVSDSLSVAADKGRILGSDKAKVWMLIVSDYQCPFCKDWHDKTWGAIRKEYVATGKIRVAYVQFPLVGIHPNARPMAIAAMCASAQDKFWPMTETIFNSQARWKELKDSRAFVDSTAKAVGLDAAKFKACMASPSIPKLVDADQVRMTRAGAQSTPTFFIGTRMLQGAQPITEFRKAIDAELSAAKPR